MNRSPAVILYDGYGTPLATLEDNIVFGEQPGLLLAGKDDNGLVRFFSVTNVGAIRTTSVGERSPVGEYYFGSALIIGTILTQNLISLENPSGSGRNLYLNRIIVNGTLNSVFSTPFIYSLTRTTGLPTGGTIQSSQKRNTLDGAPVGIVRVSPTATAASGTIWTASPGVRAGGVGGGSFFQAIKESIATFNEQKEIVIAPGEGLLITAGPNSIDWRHWANLHWNETVI
jgi:hypothetical protein